VAEDLSDVELVDLLIRNRPEGFRRFYERYGRLIYNCVRKRAGAADVDDIVQAFFERLVSRDYRPLRLWQRGTSLTVYLAKVVRNFVIDYYRAKRFREEPSGTAADLEVLLEPQDESISLKRQLDELRRLGIQAWAALEDRDRGIMCDHLHRERTNEQIAERFGLTGKAVRTALSRARARLVDKLRALAPEYFPDAV
jgi:RNA polymerase sigma factor (sigma-70 family)